MITTTPMPDGKPGRPSITICGPDVPSGYTLYFFGENNPGNGQLSTIEALIQNKKGDLWVSVWLFGCWSGWFPNTEDGANQMYELLSLFPLKAIRETVKRIPGADSGEFTNPS